jgi:hypothetical protein
MVGNTQEHINASSFKTAELEDMLVAIEPL